MSIAATVPGGGKVLRSRKGVLMCGRCPSYEAPECVHVSVHVFQWVGVTECERSKDLCPLDCRSMPCYMKRKKKVMKHYLQIQARNVYSNKN